MSSIINAPASSKPAHRRPYSSRTERRQIARHKYDESKDRKFLLRVGVLVSVLLLLALGFALKGSMDSHEAAQMESFR